MSLTNAIFRNSVFFFILIPLFAFWGFWVTYFDRSPGTAHPYEHIHGIALFGWCLMLIVQSSLIRTNRRDIHRQVGKLSYLLAPLIVRDWKSQQRRDVFLPMLFVLLATQIPSFFVVESTLWKTFAGRFMQLPLS